MKDFREMSGISSMLYKNQSVGSVRGDLKGLGYKINSIFEHSRPKRMKVETGRVDAKIKVVIQMQYIITR